MLFARAADMTSTRERILAILEARPGGRELHALAAEAGIRPCRCGQELSHLRSRGLVEPVSRAVWRLRRGPPPERPATPVPEADQCRDLWCAVVERAVRDARGDVVRSGSPESDALIVAQARAWMLSDAVGVGSLNWICEQVGLEAQYIRSAIA